MQWGFWVCTNPDPPGYLKAPGPAASAGRCQEESQLEAEPGPCFQAFSPHGEARPWESLAAALKGTSYDSIPVCLSVHPAPLPCPGTPGPCPSSCRGLGANPGPFRKLRGAAENGKIPGSALSARSCPSRVLFFFPSSQRGRLEISYPGSRLRCFPNETTRLAKP